MFLCKFMTHFRDQYLTFYKSFFFFSSSDFFTVCAYIVKYPMVFLQDTFLYGLHPLCPCASQYFWLLAFPLLNSSAVLTFSGWRNVSMNSGSHRLLIYWYLMKNKTKSILTSYSITKWIVCKVYSSGHAQFLLQGFHVVVLSVVLLSFS